MAKKEPGKILVKITAPGLRDDEPRCAECFEPECPGKEAHLTVSEKLELGRYKNNTPWVSQRKDPDGYDAYHREETRLTGLFRADAAKEMGIAGHPKEQKLWDLAWSHGHSSGLSELWIYYQEFSELLKP